MANSCSAAAARASDCSTTPAEAADLRLAGLDPAATGTDLAGELGQPLAAVGGGPGQALEALLLRGIAPARRPRAARDGGLELVRGLAHLGEQGLLLPAGLGGLGAQLLGVAAGGRLVLACPG